MTIEKLAWEFPLQDTLVDDFIFVAQGSLYATPPGVDRREMDRMVGTMTSEEIVWNTLLHIYEQKMKFLKEMTENCDFDNEDYDPEEELESLPSYRILVLRKDIAEVTLINTIYERFLKENLAAGSPGLVMDSDFSVWLVKKGLKRVVEKKELTEEPKDSPSESAPAPQIPSKEKDYLAENIYGYA